MTTVCFKTKNPVKTEAWSGIFNNLTTETESCLFIKQMTSTCISTILYLRKILSDDFFEDKSFEGMTLKLLKPKTRDNRVFKIHQWLEGAFEAIEKKYLKRLMLDIQDAESNNTLEVYTITFSYCNEKDPLNCLLSTTATNQARISASNTKLNSIKLLQMCYAVTQTYRSLPEKVTLGMRLSYHENTPDDYQPNGYVDWEHNDPEFLNTARSIEIGVTGTQHHFFKLFNKSCLSDTFFKSMEDQSKSDSTFPLGDGICKKEKLSQDKRTNARESLSSANKNSISHFPVLLNSEAQPSVPVTENSANFGKSNTRKINFKEKNSDFKVRCSCLFSKKSESMLLCSDCGFLVHSECFGILKFDSSKKTKFHCQLCHQKENDNKCPDKVLVSLKHSSDQQKLSLLRKVLGYCNKSGIKTITLKRMEKIVGADCRSNVMNVVLRKMVQIGVAIPQGEKKTLLIDRKELVNQLSKYFYKIQDSGPVKQVLPDTSVVVDSFKRKTQNEDLLHNKRIKTQPGVLQESHAHNQPASQLSYDIFS